jgi:hypothetical protein
MKHSFLADVGFNDTRRVLEDTGQKKRSRHATMESSGKSRWASSR